MDESLSDYSNELQDDLQIKNLTDPSQNNQTIQKNLQNRILIDNSKTKSNISISFALNKSDTKILSKQQTFNSQVKRDEANISPLQQSSIKQRELEFSQKMTSSVKKKEIEEEVLSPGILSNSSKFLKWSSYLNNLEGQPKNFKEYWEQKLKKKKETLEFYSVNEIMSLPKQTYTTVTPKVWSNNDMHYVIKFKKQISDRRKDLEKQGNLSSDKIQKKLDEIFNIPQPKQARSKNQIRLENEKKQAAKELKKVQNEQLIEDGFTFALNKVHDKQFIQFLIPTIQKYQSSTSPVNSSSSKSNNLLKNSFSFEVYQEFLKNKQEKKEQNKIIKLINKDKQEILNNIKNINNNRGSLKEQNFKQRIDSMKKIKEEKEIEYEKLKDLKKKIKEISSGDLNFFKKLESNSKEQEILKKNLNLMVQKNDQNVHDQEQQSNTVKKKRGAKVQPKQSLQEFHQFLRRKNILETQIFKKKYERILKHISGIPKSDAQLNPFTRQYKPSVFQENIVDPKMEIRQNQELFNNVIKLTVKERSKEEKKQVKKIVSEEDQIENEINEIRKKLQQKVKVNKEANYSEFMQFMITNSDFKHDYWKLKKDLQKKLKDEETRDAYLQSKNDFDTFQSLVKSNSRSSSFQNLQSIQQMKTIGSEASLSKVNHQQLQLNLPQRLKNKTEANNSVLSNIKFQPNNATKSPSNASKNRAFQPHKQNIQRNMLNTSSNSSIQVQNRLETQVGDQSNFQNEDHNNSQNPFFFQDQKIEFQNYLGILKRNIMSNDFKMSKPISQIDDKKEKVLKINSPYIKNVISLSPGQNDFNSVSQLSRTQGAPFYSNSFLNNTQQSFTQKSEKNQQGSLKASLKNISMNINQKNQSFQLQPVLQTQKQFPSFKQTNLQDLPKVHSLNQGLSQTSKMKKAKQSTELNYKANYTQLNIKFNQLCEEEKRQNQGKKFKKTQRVGAGSLGPNFKQKAEQFLPIIQDTQSTISHRDKIQEKLNYIQTFSTVESPRNSFTDLSVPIKVLPKLTKKEWDSIGKNKILQTTILDDIFKKVTDYQVQDKKQKKKDISTEKKQKSKKDLRQTNQKSDSDSESVTNLSIDSRDVYQNKYLEKLASKKTLAPQVKRRIDDAFALLTNLDSKGQKNQAGKIAL